MHIGHALSHFAHSAIHRVKKTFSQAKNFVVKRHHDENKISYEAAGRYNSYSRMG